MEAMTRSERRRLKKLKRQEENESDRNERLKAKTKKKIITYSIIVIVIVASVFFFYWKSQQPGKYDDFAKCLTEKGIVMAGTEWCHFCKEQKKMFGKSFEFVNYKNCDIEKVFCESNGVKGYPTWIFNETKESGVKKLPVLSQLSGCEMG